jgi:hypothetical protein
MSLRIDRSSFLTLTFGMAGLACNAGPPHAVAASVVDIPPQPPQPSDGGVAAVKVEDPHANRVLAAEADDEVEDLAPTDEGGMRFLQLDANQGQGCGWVDPKSISRPTAACKDDQGTAPSCAVMKSCSGFPFPRQECETYRKHFKPKVAQRALDCLAKLTAAQVCDACNIYRCGNLALKSACPDPSVDAQCTQVTGKCAAVSMSECRLYLSGLNAAGRAKMVSCLSSKSGCGFGIFSCSESL